MMIDTALLKASWRSWYANDLRIVGPGWLQIVWTVVFSCLVGVGFFVLGLGMRVMASGRWPSGEGMVRWLGANLTVALCIGLTIHVLFAVLIGAIGPDRIRNLQGRRKGLFFGGVPLMGTAIGWPLGAWLVKGQTVGNWFPFERGDAIVGALLVGSLISLLFYLHFDAKARQIEAEKRAAEAQLRLLQGQIEPHFLFNTLANVQALVDHDAQRAKTMLAAFTDYLRASLGGLRRDEAPLADELALAEAYLRVQQTRMDERLHFRIEAAPEVRELPLPPLLLQPLVENAVHHGLEPQVDGGTVEVRARRDGAHLVIEVQDDGRGLTAPPRKGAGMALHNLRERLSSRYGNDARLELVERAPGTLARLVLPATPVARPV
jgi:hypothetical protein